MATFNIQLPNVRQLDWNDRRTQNMLLDFFNELVEKLNYTLNNMDLTNFDRVTYVDLSKATSQASGTELKAQIEQTEGEERRILFNRLRDLIIQTAYKIEEEYTSLFNKDDKMLQSIYNMSVADVAQDGSYIGKWTSTLEQTAENVRVALSKVEAITDTTDESSLASSVNSLATKASELEGFNETISTWIDFSFSTDGFKIGRNDSPFATVITNAEMRFTQNGQTVAKISNNELIITKATINDDITVGGDLQISSGGSFSLGDYMFVIESNGSLSLKKRVIT